MSDRRLIVLPVPGRAGKWLCVVDGSVFRHLAKFRDEDAVNEFFAWVDDNAGRKLKRGNDE